MIKYSFIILLVAGQLACSSGDSLDSIGGSTSLDYSLDTVMVDPGDEILFVSGRLYQSDLSPDHKFLYNFNQHDHSFEQIDLDELKLVRKYPFEKEGPNGIGEFFRSFFLLDNDHLMVLSFPNPGIFDLSGKKLHELDFKNFGNDEDGIQDGENFVVSIDHPTEENQYLGFVRNFEKKSTELMRVDLNEGIAKRISVPQYKNLRKFDLQFSDGKSFMIYGPQSYLVEEGSKILLGSNFSNEIYQYLPESDSLLVKSYQSQLTENEKTEPSGNEFDTQEAFREAVRQVQEQISFSPPVWDDLYRVYYRFSHKEVFEDASTEAFQFPTATEAEVYLTIFDENLSMLAETEISSISMPPQKHFVKDGKIWMFVNMEDEIGFVRLAIDLGIEPLPSDGIQRN
ncbi:DUF4221 family protein [Lunatibacter salilacus]|uniref:DUF4221 family protein n=1 Tax=Lunatibacter salilacus TaxID=2483804 RepID=UPI00131D82D3|nr:DUF4221 family protein [Lunatibacter salilacus]